MSDTSSYFNIQKTDGTVGVGFGADGATLNGATMAAGLKTTVTLSAAQIKALRATPITLVAAPAAGFAAIPSFAVWNYTAGATPFTINAGQISLFLGATLYADNSTTATPAPTGFIDQATSQIVAYPIGAKVPISVTNSAAKAIIVKNDAGAEFTAGNGTLTITIVYNIVAVA